MKKIILDNFSIANDAPFVLIAGPCQLESLNQGLDIAGFLKETTQNLGIPYIFKASFDKANRTSLKGKRGMGLDACLKAFEAIKKEIKCPILTDIHEPFQCDEVKEVVDILQIPAFLCRQTDLLLKAGQTGKIINIKKGQFLAPWDMKGAVEKVESTGNTNIILTERGSCFGYNTLVVDMRSFPIMKNLGYPVVFDATHAVQAPGGNGSSSGGNREYAPVLANAAITCGLAGVFMETHPDPDSAPSDGPNMIYLKDMPKVLANLKALDNFTKQEV